MFIYTWQILNFSDFLLAPFLLILCFSAAFYYKRQKLAGKALEKYFIPALSIKLSCAILFGLVYQYYYGYGDTFYYYLAYKDIFNALLSSPGAAFEMIFLDPEQWDINTQNFATFKMFFMKDNESPVVRIAGFFSLISLGTYFGISIIFSLLCFWGCWLIYNIFYELYPHLHKPLAYAILFVPSMCFWGSGLMKDPLVVFGLGYFLHGFYCLFLRKDKHKFHPFFKIFIGIILMANIKAYVLVSVLPPAIIWWLYSLKDKIQNRTIRTYAGPFVLVFSLLMSILALSIIEVYIPRFSIDNFLYEAGKVQWWLTVSSERDGGAGYTLGDFEPTIFGLIKIFPKAVNVALFRPYLWEANKVILIPTVIESLLAMLFSLYILLKIRPLKFISGILNDADIVFCLSFSVIFAFCVGFTSFNFGALARYKIPCLPFYFTGLVLLLNKYHKPSRQKPLIEK